MTFHEGITAFAFGMVIIGMLAIFGIMYHYRLR